MFNNINKINNLYYFSGVIADKNNPGTFDLFNKSFSVLKKIPLFAIHVNEDEEISKINIREAVNRIIGYITDFNYNEKDKILTIFGFIFENDIDILNDRSKLSLEAIETDNLNILIGVATTDSPAFVNAEIYHVVKMSYKDMLQSYIENNYNSYSDIDYMVNYLYDKHINLNTINYNILNNGNNIGDNMTKTDPTTNQITEMPENDTKKIETNPTTAEVDDTPNKIEIFMDEVKNDINELKSAIDTIQQVITSIADKAKMSTEINQSDIDINSNDDIQYKQKYEELLNEYEKVKQEMEEYKTTIQKFEQQLQDDLNARYEELISKIKEIVPDFDDSKYVDLDKQVAINVLEDFLNTLLSNKQDVDLSIKKFSLEYNKKNPEDDVYEKAKEIAKQYI